MSDYNGWTNKETWLVNMWYMDKITEPYADFTTKDCNIQLSLEELACASSGLAHAKTVEGIETGSSESGLASLTLSCQACMELE